MIGEVPISKVKTLASARRVKIDFQGPSTTWESMWWSHIFVKSRIVFMEVKISEQDFVFRGGDVARTIRWLYMLSFYPKLEFRVRRKQSVTNKPNPVVGLCALQIIASGAPTEPSNGWTALRLSAGAGFRTRSAAYLLAEGDTGIWRGS